MSGPAVAGPGGCSFGSIPKGRIPYQNPGLWQSRATPRGPRLVDLVVQLSVDLTEPRIVFNYDEHLVPDRARVH